METRNTEFLFLVAKASKTLGPCAATGGVARQIYSKETPDVHSTYPDVDVVIEYGDSITPEICTDFYISHYHPDSDRGKLLVQLACKETFKRIDVFTSKDDGVLMRSNLHRINGIDVRVVTKEDIQLNLIGDLIRVLDGRRVNSKYYHYMVKLHEIIDAKKIDEIIQNFTEYSLFIDYESIFAKISNTWSENRELFTEYEYSTTIESCPNCVVDNNFPLVDKKVLLKEWGFV